MMMMMMMMMMVEPRKKMTMMMMAAPRKMVMKMMMMVLHIVCGMLMPMMARAGRTDDTTNRGGQFPIYTNSRSPAHGGCYS